MSNPNLTKGELRAYGAVWQYGGISAAARAVGRNYRCLSVMLLRAEAKGLPAAPRGRPGRKPVPRPPKPPSRQTVDVSETLPAWERFRDWLMAKDVYREMTSQKVGIVGRRVA